MECDMNLDHALATRKRRITQEQISKNKLVLKTDQEMMDRWKDCVGRNLRVRCDCVLVLIGRPCACHKFGVWIASSLWARV
eukprot:3476729-Alexandrium_andersonii.AAC.1